MDFTLPPEVEEARLAIRHFVADRILPLEVIRPAMTIMRI